jgi:hypothetical protein
VTTSRPRAISVVDSKEAWDDLCREIDALPAADRFEVQVTGLDRSEEQRDRVGRVLARGYSPELRDGGAVVLAPRPAGVLYLVSDLGGAGDPLGWLSALPSGSFRQHLLAIDMSVDNFAALTPDFAGESWHLDTFLGEGAVAEFVMEFMGSRQIDLVHVVDSRLGFDLLPFVRYSYPRTRVTADVGSGEEKDRILMTYATSRYGNVVDGFCASSSETADQLAAAFISSSRITLVPGLSGSTDADAVALEHRRVFGRQLAALIT